MNDMETLNTKETEKAKPKDKNAGAHNIEYPQRKLRREQEEAPEGVCPYFIRDRGKGVIYCECARFHFPDKLARREIVYTYCAHPTGYKQCVLKHAMDGFYRRKYERADAAETATEGGRA